MKNKLEKPGFLVCWNGGTGLRSSESFAHHARQFLPHPTVQVGFDTDPDAGSHLARLDEGDEFVSLQMTPNKVNVLKSNPNLFGPAMKAIVEQQSEWLDPAYIHQGSRTVRLITDVAFRMHYRKVRRALRNALLALIQRGEVDHVNVILAGSSGGGCGSAITPLLARTLNDERKRQMLLRHLNVQVRKPIVFAADPIAQAEQVRDAHARLILSNAFAFRVETVRFQDDYEYLFYLGFASPAGVVLDQPEKIGKVLGLTVHQFISHWPKVKGLLVNTDSFRKHRYLGDDLGENGLSKAG